MEKINEIQWMSQEVRKTDETEWENEQIGRENWLKSHDKIKEWTGNYDERQW